MIYLIDPEGRIQYVNTSSARAFQTTPQDLVGKQISDLFPPDVALHHVEGIRKVISTRQPVIHEIAEVLPSGKIWIDVRLSPVIDHENRVIGVLGLSNDITQRKTAEEALRESEDRLRTIMQSVQTGIVIIDAGTHTILDANRKALAMIGAKKAEVIGSHCHRFICPCEQGECPITDLGQGADASERVLITKSGASIPVLKTVIPATIDGRTVLVESVMDISEMKSREDRIRILAGLLDLMPASVTVHNPEGGFLFANEKTFEYHGYTAGEFCKINLHELDVPESEHLIEERIRQLKETGEVSFEVQHYRKDRSVIPLLVNARITIWDGSPVILSIATDITERKQAEQKLVAAYQEYQNLLDQIQDVYYRSDTEGRLIRISRSLADMLGYRDVSELLGKNIAEEFYLNPGDRTKLLEEITRDGKVTNYEVQLRRKDGTPVTISASSHIWYHPDETPGGVEGSFRDITEQKRAENALRESELLLREIFDNANDAIFLLERYPAGPGKYLLVNDKAVRMLGYSQEELLTMSPRDIVPEDIARKVMPAVIQKLLRDGHATFESAHRRKDGSIYPIEVSTHTFRYQGKDVDLSIIRDITERKRSVQIIQETNKKISLLSSITRHDVANQVSLLKGYATIALMKKPDPVVAEFLAKIDTAGSTIARQIEFTREYEELGMHAPGWHRIQEIVALQKTEGISFSCTCDAEIFTDPMIEKVFFNLFDNATRHGERVTAITIGCERAPDGGMLIVVEDNGAGIPLEDKEKIFEKGFGKNTGFGLFLVREILAITGIVIRETGIPGEGARFEISVPKEGYRFTS
jgi:PAS domain S-box-containing protein